MESEYLPNVRVNFVLFKKLNVQLDKKKALISAVNVFIRKFIVKRR